MSTKAENVEATTLSLLDRGKQKGKLFKLRKSVFFGWGFFGFPSFSQARPHIFKE